MVKVRDETLTLLGAFEGLTEFRWADESPLRLLVLELLSIGYASGFWQ